MRVRFFCLKRQTRHPVPTERLSLFLPVIKLTEKARSAGFQALSLVPGLGSAIRRTSLADQAKVRRAGIFSKISGNQIIRTPASANVDLGSGGAYQISVGIERAQKTRVIGAGIWLN